MLCRYRDSALLRNHTETLCVLQYVATYSTYYQVYFPDYGAVVGKLHFHLSRVDLIYR